MLDLKIEAQCLFDRDFRGDSEIDAFKKKLLDEGLLCHVLGRKEIENHLLEPHALQRAANKRLRTAGQAELSLEIVAQLLDEATKATKTRVSSQLAANELRYLADNGSRDDASTTLQRSSVRFEKLWSQMEDRLRIVPGKDVLADLNTILSSRYKVSLTPNLIIDSILLKEFATDLRTILEALNIFCQD